MEDDVKARIERCHQGCFVRVRSRVACCDVVAGERIDVLTRAYPYNARPVSAGAAVEVWAGLPPFAEVESRRRKWLVAEVERATRALGDPPRGDDADSKSANTAAAAKGGGDHGPAVDAIRIVAEGKGWRTSEAADGAFEVAPPAPAGLARAFTVRSGGEGAHIEAPLSHVAPSGPGAQPLATELHAVLALNARFGFARLRPLEGSPRVLRVEHQLPASGLLEDEIDHALEGVRHAVEEAARTFETLRHPAVAREYALVYELAP
jgi:hypothetical protein